MDFSYATPELRSLAHSHEYRIKIGAREGGETKWLLITPETFTRIRDVLMEADQVVEQAAEALAELQRLASDSRLKVPGAPPIPDDVIRLIERLGSAVPARPNRAPFAYAPGATGPRPGMPTGKQGQRQA